MKRTLIYAILINIMFFSFINSADAALDLRISSNSSTKLSPGVSYSVSVVYVDLNNRGTLSSLDFDMTFQNANCSITSGSCNQSNHCSFTNVKKGATLVQLNCVKGKNNESFIVNNVVGKNSSGSLDLRLASLSISTDTTTTILQTTTTIPKVVTSTTTTTTKRRTTKTTTTTTTTEVTTEPVTVELPQFDVEKSELKLKNLNIIGYDLDFDKDNMEYTIVVNEDVTELDVVATPLSKDIVVQNTGRVSIKDLNEITIKLSREEEETIYTIKIERKKVKKINFLFYVIVILAIIVVSGLIIMQLINRYNLKKEELEFFKEIEDGKEDAQTLLEEEEEFTKTFFDLNKR